MKFKMRNPENLKSDELLIVFNYGSLWNKVDLNKLKRTVVIIKISHSSTFVHMVSLPMDTTGWKVLI